MSSASDSIPSTAGAAPSLFLSYSSEDRAAARQLRDGLAAAGLEVWYDENELGGGDAWDQKIRRQIRECRYFMPVISASTERRSEGYFRREWKLAVERTHDMADDVMFLVPVVIDDTRDAGARVPEKFFTVQWLRIPGGQSGPALTALARRLVSGEIPPPARAPASVPASAASRRSAAEAVPEGPPPMPPFPAKPADGHKLHYVATVLWWGISAAWLIFKRFPRWVRVILVLIALSSLLRCGSSRDKDEDNPPATAKQQALSAEKKQAIKKALAEVGKDADGDVSVSELMRAGAKIADNVATEIDKEKLVDGQIGVVAFGAGFEGASRETVEATYAALFGQLAIARPALIKPLDAALASGPDHDLLAAAAKAGDTLVVTTARELTDSEEFLKVRLLKTADGSVAWSGRYAVAYLKDPAALKKISQAILDATPKE